MSRRTDRVQVKTNKNQQSCQVILERVIGFTTNNNCGLALNEKNGFFAHAAGCVVVLNSFKTDKQYFIQSPYRKAISALDISSDGKYLATGESGHQPMVRIWNISDGTQMAELGGHHFRVVAVRFSPNDQIVISLGSQEDHTLFVWNRQNGQRLASAKVTHKIHGIAFSPSGQYFVTVGVRSVRYWYLENKRNKIRETLPLQGRNAVLGDMFNNSFTDVVCVSVVTKQSDKTNGAGSIHNNNNNSNNNSVSTNQTNKNILTNPGNSDDTLSKQTTLTLVVNLSGQLLQFNDQRELDKWVDLKTPRANCISASFRWVVVGCANGTCLIFEAETLQFIQKLPNPHCLGSTSLSNETLLKPLQTVPNATLGQTDSRYPDLVAVKLDSIHNYLIAFYNDHSIHIWDMSSKETINTSDSCDNGDNVVSISTHRSHYYHSRGIWSIDCYQNNPSNCSANDASPVANENKFLTCSDDGTIRFWSYNSAVLTNTPMALSSTTFTSTPDKSNVPKEQLANVIYTDPNLKYLCVGDRVLTSGGIAPLGGMPSCCTNQLETNSSESGPSSPVSPSKSLSSVFPNLEPVTTTAPAVHCVRIIAISPDQCHLAVGDRDGYLQIYSLDTFELIHGIQAHDSEILSLNFFRSDLVPQLSLLCSASRDRVIHLFDPNQNYSQVQTITDHSGAIFAAKIIETDDGEIRLISCGMDKSLLFRVLEPDETGQTAYFALEHHLVSRHSQLDASISMCLSGMSATTTTTAAATTTTGTLSHNPGVETPNRSSSNRKCYLAVACQDRRLRIYNAITARPVRCYRGSYTEDGFLVRCTIDPTGSIIATSGSDKQLNMFHLVTGELIATFYGHSELALGLKFLPSLTHFVSVSADGCIFVWRLSIQLTKYLNEQSCKLANCGGNLSSSSSSAVACTNPATADHTEPSALSSILFHRTRFKTISSPNNNNNPAANGSRSIKRAGSERVVFRSVAAHSAKFGRNRYNKQQRHHLERQYSNNNERNHSLMWTDSWTNLCMSGRTEYDLHTDDDEEMGNRENDYIDVDDDDDDGIITDDTYMTANQCSDLEMSFKSKQITEKHYAVNHSSLSNGPSDDNKKPIFYFSVSALPAWAQRKLSRRDSVSMAPCNQMNQITNCDRDSIGSDSLSQNSGQSCNLYPYTSSSSNSNQYGIGFSTYQEQTNKTSPNYNEPMKSVQFGSKLNTPNSELEKSKAKLVSNWSSRGSLNPGTATPRTPSGKSSYLNTSTTLCNAAKTSNKPTRPKDLKLACTPNTPKSYSTTRHKAGQTYPGNEKCTAFERSERCSSVNQLALYNKTRCRTEIPASHYFNFYLFNHALLTNSSPTKIIAGTATNNNNIDHHNYHHDHSVPMPKRVRATWFRFDSQPVGTDESSVIPSCSSTNKSMIDQNKKNHLALQIKNNSQKPPSNSMNQYNSLINIHRDSRLNINDLAATNLSSSIAENGDGRRPFTKPTQNSLLPVNCNLLAPNQEVVCDSQSASHYSPSKHPHTNTSSLLDLNSLTGNRARWLESKGTKMNCCFSDVMSKQNHLIRSNSLNNLSSSPNGSQIKSYHKKLSQSIETIYTKLSLFERCSTMKTCIRRRNNITDDDDDDVCNIANVCSCKIDPAQFVVTDQNDPSCVQLAKESLKEVRVALDLAVKRISKLSTTDVDQTVLRQAVTDDLEWRFTRLRAILGLSPICVEAPVARVLLNEFVERLIPELKSVQMNELRSEKQLLCKNESSNTTESSLVDWVVGSTTDDFRICENDLPESPVCSTPTRHMADSRLADNRIVNKTNRLKTSKFKASKNPTNLTKTLETT